MTGTRYPEIVISGVPVVATPAEIDITSADELRSALLRADAGSPDTLVVNMSRTQFCDSSGLHALIAAHKRARAEGREVLLVIPDTPVLRVFAITGMDRVIPTFTTLDEALARPATPVRAHSHQPAEGDAHAEKQPVRPVTS